MDDLITTAEAAKRLGITKQAMADWRLTWPRQGESAQPHHKKLGPQFYRLGDGSRARVRYRVSDIDAWLAECAA
ncbi:helix-turn-helix domain-containing protein [Epidermidibacterium keratini]|uniref:Helix-turn-helix domain-containing protein n=1 Tax=Epidermidibacterium keratini TaxID=1891644 RepID=A0A7L4YK66_9ACTN|nr:helix-turn-helix domain-containing protein [Epidermidibacterium keratini]QHB99447.1 helix-turn-helix domain-containing protein [Epidermidibacterium keratini]